MGCHARHKAALATPIYSEARSSSDGEVDEEVIEVDEEATEIDEEPSDPVTVRRARARRVGAEGERVWAFEA